MNAIKLILKTLAIIITALLFCILISIESWAATIASQNNNPVNLKAFVQWDGMTGRDKYGHAVFSSLDYGTRAALKNAQTHQKRHPNQTLEGWMKTFAEKNGEHEAEYIAGKMNVSRETLLKDLDMAKLVKHQAWFEGRIELTDDYINKVRRMFGL